MARGLSSDSDELILFHDIALRDIARLRIAGNSRDPLIPKIQIRGIKLVA